VSGILEYFGPVNIALLVRQSLEMERSIITSRHSKGHGLGLGREHSLRERCCIVRNLLSAWQHLAQHAISKQDLLAAVLVVRLSLPVGEVEHLQQGRQPSQQGGRCTCKQSERM
jgi:hypothetical protein